MDAEIDLLTPVPPITAQKKGMGTIASPTLPEDFLALLLFYCS